MTVVFAEDTTPAAPVTTRGDTRTIWLESFDGSLIVPLDGDPIKLLRGAQGLTKVPEEPVVTTTPGLPGGYLEDVQVLVRTPKLPLQIKARSQAAAWDAMARLRAVLRYKRRAATREGSCYLVCSSASGIRRLTVAYESGLEGEDLGMPGLDRFVLSLVAVDPYARDREMRTLTFELPDDGEGFLSDDPADTFETRSLASSTVFGQNMTVDISSEVEVFSRLDFLGPFGPGLHVTASTGFAITVPDGVPTGSALTIVTDPRAVSIRLDGDPAAGRIARPWSLGNPFLPGRNRMDVVGPGATAASKVIVSWRGGWESMW